jgi:hypothetical protein
MSSALLLVWCVQVSVPAAANDIPLAEPLPPVEIPKKLPARNPVPLRLAGATAAGALGVALAVVATFWLTVPNPAFDSTLSNGVMATLLGAGFAQG